MPKTAASAADQNSPASFEAAMQELEQLVHSMEAGDLPLDSSVEAYRRGSDLVRYCAQQLERIEAQVKVLDADMLKPFSVAAIEGASS